MSSTIAVVGDLILDKYIIGNTSRISPEAPVPIVEVQSEKFTLGGAANVAHNLINLGCPVNLYGAIGEDREGYILNELCLEKKINVDYYQTEDIPTTAKTRIISRNQQMMRIDKEALFCHSPKSLAHYKKYFTEYTLIVVSDYGKGFCSDDFLELLFTNKQDECKIMVDPKGKNWEKYNGAFLVKPNIAELEEILSITIHNGDEDIAKYGRLVYEKYNFEHLIITRGSKGMTYIGKSHIKHYATQSVEVYDVSGAGDTAMAVIALAISNGKSIDDAIVQANIASSYVVTKPLTYAISIEEFEKLM
jgi:rfaE bifunctional protein kinase chain/domain